PLDLLGRGDVLLVRLRAQRAETDTVLVDPEDDVPPALERALLELLDREEDRAVDALERARQHVRAEERLVAVDSDPPHVVVLRGRERAEAATAGALDHALGAGRDLVQRELLALRLVLPVLGVVPAHLRPRHGRPRTRLVPGDEAVDGRLLEAADGAHGLRAGPLRLERREVADEVADLLLAKQQPL